ncbi:hypothetical protein RRG08_002656 [Elysia crispata]|uniref:DUF4097 domain-containing protein n=1 Tax=Elysia crispata TaxID=231223 RepID=A0AAE0XU29_9GAST|nr:hypothetical protein RRG08_002656 [Elysia crispata]
MGWDHTSGAKSHAWTDAGDIDWDHTSGAKGHAWTEAGTWTGTRLVGRKVTPGLKLAHGLGPDYGAKGHAWTDAGDIDWDHTSGAKGHAWTDAGDIDWDHTSGAKGHAWTEAGDIDWDHTSGAKGHAWTEAGDIDWDQTSGAKGHAWTEAGDIDWDQTSGAKGHAWTEASDIDWDHFALGLKRRASAPAAPATNEQLRALYQRSVQLESQIEQSEIRSLEARADAELARKEALVWQQKENYFRALVTRIVEDPSKPAPLDKHCLSLV